MSPAGIYLITNTSNGKAYVGSSVNLDRRLNEHLWSLRSNRHENSKLQRAWNKYGEDVFTLSPIECVLNPSDLVGREQFWMDELDAVAGGYNMVPVAGNCLGYKHTPEAIANMKEAHTRRVPLTPERKEALALLSRSRAGVPLTAEHRERLSQSARAYCAGRGKVTHSPEVIEKIRQGNLGRKRSPETIRRMGEAQARRQERIRQAKENQNASTTSTTFS